jgi:hypothetical protein
MAVIDAIEILAPQQSAATPDVLSFFGKPTNDAFATQEKARADVCFHAQAVSRFIINARG